MTDVLRNTNATHLGDKHDQFPQVLGLLVWICFKDLVNALIMCPLLEKLLLVSSRVSLDEILELW